ncbi:hypothetical protein [Demequina sp. NBRC 110055]|uniref:hypothetical protein n=1 Tax=Demequina sp. NBRC 110055 TaxID=1570344 RepID=UPI0011850DD6|nr:hypothetical protein [Demequina sp. NBRC 110055]
MEWLRTIRRVRWSWALAAVICLVIGFVTFTNASQLSCTSGEECWFTIQDRIGQGLIATATIVAVGWCAWHALRHDPGIESDDTDPKGETTE